MDVISDIRNISLNLAEAKFSQSRPCDFVVRFANFESCVLSHNLLFDP